MASLPLCFPVISRFLHICESHTFHDTVVLNLLHQLRRQRCASGQLPSHRLSSLCSSHWTPHALLYTDMPQIGLRGAYPAYEIPCTFSLQPPVDSCSLTSVVDLIWCTPLHPWYRVRYQLRHVSRAKQRDRRIRHSQSPLGNWSCALSDRSASHHSGCCSTRVCILRIL